jgi:hypothetical protein
MVIGAGLLKKSVLASGLKLAVSFSAVCAAVFDCRKAKLANNPTITAAQIIARIVPFNKFLICVFNIFYFSSMLQFADQNRFQFKQTVLQNKPARPGAQRFAAYFFIIKSRFTVQP